jgi:hypothetical protein
MDLKENFIKNFLSRDKEKVGWKIRGFRLIV